MEGFAFRIATSATVPSAIGAIDVIGDVDAAIAAMRIREVGVGRVGLRSIESLDEFVIARFADSSAVITPHGGVAVMYGIAARLAELGGRDLTRSLTMADVRALHPEARSGVDALALEAIPHVASAEGVRLLLAQHAAWEKGASGYNEEEESTLARLVRPPTVCLWGETNIGKSSLLNALASRSVAVTHDSPGVTRDYVGVELDLDGVVVRLIDLPGVLAPGHAGELDVAAWELAVGVATHADLIVRCVDAGSSFVDPPEGFVGSTLDVGLRADLSDIGQRVRISTSSMTGEGLVTLSTQLRESLVPGVLLASDRKWRFWDAVGGLPDPIHPG